MQLEVEIRARRALASAQQSVKDATTARQAAIDQCFDARVAVEKALVDLDRVLLDGSDGPHLMTYADLDWRNRAAST